MTIDISAQVSTELIDDYFPADSPQVDAKAVSVRVPGEVGVTIYHATADSLVELRSDGASHGLRQKSHAIAGISAVHAATTDDGAVLVLEFHPQKNADPWTRRCDVYERKAGGELTSIRQFDHYAGAVCMRHDPDGNFVVLLPSLLQGFLLVWKKKGESGWHQQPIPVLGNAIPCSFISLEFHQSDANGTLFMIRNVGQDVCTRFDGEYRLSDDRPNNTHMAVEQSAKILAGCRCLYLPGVPSALIHDTDYGLCTWNDRLGRLDRIAGLPRLASPHVGTDSQGRVFLFGVDYDSNELGVARNFSLAGPVKWQTLGTLAKSMIGVSCGDVTDLVVQQADGSLLHLSQAALVGPGGRTPIGRYGPWRSRPIKTDISEHSKQLEHLNGLSGDTLTLPHSVYIYDVTLQAPSGHPVSGAAVTVGSDGPVAFVAGGLVFHVDAARSVKVPSDVAGHLEVRVLADGLASPTLTFDADQADTLTANAHDAAHARLAATTEDDVASAPVPVGMDRASASRSLRAAGASLQKMARKKAGETDIGATTGLEFTVTGRGEGCKFTYREVPIPGESGIDPDNWLDDIFSDVVHAFKSLAHKLEKVVITIYDDVVHFVMNGVDYVIRDFHQAVGAIEGLLARISHAIGDAIKAVEKWVAWLRALFKWQDILYTAQALGAMIGNFGNSLNQFETTLAKHFDSLTFTPGEAAKKIGSKNLSQLAPKGDGDDAIKSKFTKKSRQHSARINYAHKRSTNMRLKPSAGSAIREDGDNPLFDVIARVATPANLKKWEDNITSKVKPIDFSKGPAAALDAGMEDVLGVLEGVALDIAELGGEIFGAMMHEMKQNFSVLHGDGSPPAEDLLTQWLFGRDCTVADVALLVLAVPTTILYKLARDDQAPFDAGSANFWAGVSLLDGIASGRVSPDEADADDADTLLWIVLCLRVVAAASDATLDAAALSRAKLPPVVDGSLSFALSACTIASFSFTIFSAGKTYKGDGAAGNKPALFMILMGLVIVVPNAISAAVALMQILKKRGSTSSLRVENPLIWGVLGALAFAGILVTWIFNDGKPLSGNSTLSWKQGVPALVDTISCVDKFLLFFGLKADPASKPYFIAATCCVDLLAWMLPPVWDLLVHHSPEPSPTA